MTGPEAPIFLPEITRGEGSDYEVEICAVIGKPGKNITVEKAYEHVLGYCTVNDVSPRISLRAPFTFADLLTRSDHFARSCSQGRTSGLRKELRQ